MSELQHGVTNSKDQPEVCNNADIEDEFVKKLSEKEVSGLEKMANYKQKMHGIELENFSFWFIVACAIALILIYVGDVVLINNHLVNSKLVDSVFELLKYIISSLVGFVFASKIKNS